MSAATAVQLSDVEIVDKLSVHAGAESFDLNTSAKEKPAKKNRSSTDASADPMEGTEASAQSPVRQGLARVKNTRVREKRPPSNRKVVAAHRSVPPARLTSALGSSAQVNFLPFL